MAISSFGQGTGSIYLDNVGCTGTELYLANCTNNGIEIHNCDHSEDAGVMCVISTIQCNNGDLRLIGGSNSFEGRVEICWNNEWATVCDDSWGSSDAAVVCNQLQYSSSGMQSSIKVVYVECNQIYLNVKCCLKSDFEFWPLIGAQAFGSATFGQGASLSAILLDDVSCIGSESRLLDCSNSGIGNHNCLHSEDAGVRCIPICEWLCDLPEGKIINICVIFSFSLCRWQPKASRESEFSRRTCRNLLQQHLGYCL